MLWCCKLLVLLVILLLQLFAAQVENTDVNTMVTVLINVVAALLLVVWYCAGRSVITVLPVVTLCVAIDVAGTVMML